jgi:hypothetical protein
MENENNNTNNNNINILPLVPIPSTENNEIGEIDNIAIDNESVNALENNSPEESMNEDNNEEFQHPDDIEYDRFDQYMNELNEEENLDMLDSAYEHRYNNFEKYIESSDYTTNYGENDEGDYENY